MKRISKLSTKCAIMLIAFFAMPVLESCSKDSDSDKPRIEHSIQVRFVDEHKNNLFNDRNTAIDAIKYICYDNEGNEQDFHTSDWFAPLGYTVSFEGCIFGMYFTLPEEGGSTTTETYIRFLGGEPDVFTAEYDVKQGKNSDEPYGGGTVKVKTVKLNGSLIWSRDNQPQGPVDIVKGLP